jgi:hypothetical protein
MVTFNCENFIYISLASHKSSNIISEHSVYSLAILLKLTDDFASTVHVHSILREDAEHRVCRLLCSYSTLILQIVDER